MTVLATPMLAEVFRANLRRSFTPYVETDSVRVHEFESRHVAVEYLANDRAAVSINVICDICYVLHTILASHLRGRGIGWSLYEAVHGFAREAGCRVVRRTPSGGYFRGGVMIQSRRDYLLKRGYRPFDDMEVEIEVGEAPTP